MRILNYCSNCDKPLFSSEALDQLALTKDWVSFSAPISGEIGARFKPFELPIEEKSIGYCTSCSRQLLDGSGEIYSFGIAFNLKARSRSRVKEMDSLKRN